MGVDLPGGPKLLDAYCPEVRGDAGGENSLLPGMSGKPWALALNCSSAPDAYFPEVRGVREDEDSLPPGRLGKPWALVLNCSSAPDAYCPKVREDMGGEDSLLPGGSGKPWALALDCSSASVGSMAASMSSTLLCTLLLACTHQHHDHETTDWGFTRTLQQYPT